MHNDKTSMLSVTVLNTVDTVTVLSAVDAMVSTRFSLCTGPHSQALHCSLNISGTGSFEAKSLETFAGKFPVIIYLERIS